jgi:hypothetical protein
MSHHKVRLLSLTPALALVAGLVAWGGAGAPASASGHGTGAATCKQLTKAQIQPLMSTPITKIMITKALQTGQQCVYSGASGGAAIDVLVLKGAPAKQGFQEDLRSLDHKVAVPGVGARAYRAKGDYQIDSLSGTESCSVSVGEEDTVPGVAALEANGSADIAESANAIVARALGTICNRIYKKGSTTPSLAGL